MCFAKTDLLTKHCTGSAWIWSKPHVQQQFCHDNVNWPRWATTGSFKYLSFIYIYLHRLLTFNLFGVFLKVYQASTTTRTAPGGVREVQRSVSDSRSGVRKMAVGRHLGERGHVVEKEQNYYTGDSEEREDFINIEEGKIVV
jgi:hypothetical protein